MGVGGLRPAPARDRRAARAERASRWPAIIAATALAACSRPSAPAAGGAPRLLDPAAQRTAAERIVRGFVDVCVNAADALAATHGLQAQGWPPFGAVWREPTSVFYAAKPTAASPAGMFVLSDLRSGGAQVLSCVAHYGAGDAAAMREVLERRWGPGEVADLPDSRQWTFRLAHGALTPVPGVRGRIDPGALAALRPGEALVYAQVSYNAQTRDVASLVSVWRRAAPPGRP